MAQNPQTRADKIAARSTKKTGFTDGKSNAPGMGGRAQQLKNQGVPQGVIGAIARKKGMAPGQPGFHKGAKAS